jgi:dTDP-4-dehydrorhamnose reductase
VKPRILILGSQGMAGHIIKTYLLELGYEVFSTSREKNRSKNHFYYDVLEDIVQLDKIIASVKPDFVINCIGILNKAAEEDKEGAVLVNSYLPHYVDALSEKYRFKFIHISTDCVFSGEKGKYNEEDIPDATSFYGRSKAIGEIINERSLTLRTSIVGPDVNPNGIGLFNWFMKQTGQIKGYNKAIWTGVTTLQLAKSIETVFENDVSGLYHLVNNATINKYDLLHLFKKHMDKDDVEIQEYDGYASDKSLVNNRNDFDFNIPSYEQMVSEMSDCIHDHKDLYENVVLSRCRR